MLRKFPVGLKQRLYLQAQHQGIFHLTNAIRVLDVLQVGHDVQPARGLDTVVQLGHVFAVLFGQVTAGCIHGAGVVQVHRTGVDTGDTCAEGVGGAGVEWAFVDQDQPDAAGVGEILLGGPRLMRGYWQLEALNAKTLDNGWLRSGDLGRIGPDGLLWVLGRCNDIIRSGGKSVQPGEVEQNLLRHPGVQDVHVFGLEDLEWGEQVCAAVVLEGSQDLSAQ